MFDPRRVWSWAFPLRGRKQRLPSQWSMMHACVRQRVAPLLHWHECGDTLLCKCQPHPIKWLSDAIAHEGIPLPFNKVVFVVRFVSVFFPPHFFSRDYSKTSALAHALTAHAVSDETSLLYHVPRCSSLILCLWLSRVMSVLVIHLQAVLTTYTPAIFTTVSVCSLQCWLPFDYWLLVLAVRHPHCPARSQWWNSSMLFKINLQLTDFRRCCLMIY